MTALPTTLRGNDTAALFQTAGGAGDATCLQRRIGDHLIRVLLDGQKMIAAFEALAPDGHVEEVHGHRSLASFHGHTKAARHRRRVVGAGRDELHEAFAIVHSEEIHKAGARGGSFGMP